MSMPALVGIGVLAGVVVPVVVAAAFRALLRRRA